MISALGNPPVPDPRRPLLTLRTAPLMHISPICSVHIATDGTFGLVCVLSVIGPRHSARQPEGRSSLLSLSERLAPLYSSYSLPPVREECKRILRIIEYRKLCATVPHRYRYFFCENRKKCLLSSLVVMPPCHPWLSPLLVTLTGSGKRRKILSGRALPRPV